MKHPTTLRQRRQAERRRLSRFTNGPAARDLSSPAEARGPLGVVEAARPRGPVGPRWVDGPASTAVDQALPVPAPLRADLSPVDREPAAFGAVDEAAAQSFKRSLSFTLRGVANDG